MAKKIVNGNLTKYELICTISCYEPPTVAINQLVAEKRMQKVMQILYDSDHITDATTDKVSSKIFGTVYKSKRKLKGKIKQFC